MHQTCNTVKLQSRMPPGLALKETANWNTLLVPEKLMHRRTRNRRTRGACTRGFNQGHLRRDSTRGKRQALGPPRAPDLPLPRFLPRAPTKRAKSDQSIRSKWSDPRLHPMLAGTHRMRGGAAQEFPHSSRGGQEQAMGGSTF